MEVPAFIKKAFTCSREAVNGYIKKNHQNENSYSDFYLINYIETRPFVLDMNWVNWKIWYSLKQTFVGHLRFSWFSQPFALEPNGSNYKQ